MEMFEYVQQVLRNQLDNDTDSVMRKYRNKPSKMKKYLNRLNANFDKNIRNAHEAILEGVSDAERRLYIYSVDDFEIESQVVEDAKTVVIS